VFSQQRKPVIIPQFPENMPDKVNSDEDDDDENFTDDESQLSNEETSEQVQEEVSEEEQEEEMEKMEESIEQLAAGREEKEDADIIIAICNAAKPQEKIKPPDLRSSVNCMVTDISFHPSKELIAMSNIEGEITWYILSNNKFIGFSNIKFIASPLS
jgi:glutamyl/glutaminyl-tRNA synthetase